MDEVAAESGGDDSVIGRPHIARVLVNKGVCTEISDAFAKYIGNNGPAFVRRWLPPPEEVAKAIAAAGGISIWAHPSGDHRPPASRIRKHAAVLKEAGIDGIEGYYSHYTPEQSDAVLQIASDLEMCVSGGSDFHGDNRPGVSLGIGKGDLKVSEAVLAALKSYQEKYR
jgi:predicted metal-dependent phosphoesterase TrpH